MIDAVIFFADGMEECEALVTLDLLRRANLNVQTVSINDNKKIYTSSKVYLSADKTIDEINFDKVKMLILPGGMPGTLHLGKCKKVQELCTKFNSENKYLAAICAAPSVLGQLNLLEGKNATCYPGFEGKLTGATKVDSGIVVDGNIITAEALGSAFDFAQSLITALKNKKRADKISNEICIRH